MLSRACVAVRRVSQSPVSSLPWQPRRHMAVLYTAHAHTTGGRNGHTRTDDKKLDLDLSTPKEMGGPGGKGTNPEQLFAAGYSACFLGAMGVAAKKLNVTLPKETAIDSNVTFNKNGEKLEIGVSFDVTAPGLDKKQLQQVIDSAHQICPYSNATRGNIEFKATAK